MLIFFGLLSVSSQELGYINDSDGYTNLREDQSAESNIIGVITNGQEFQYFPDKTSSWWKVQFYHRTGYMHKSRIKSFATAKMEISKFYKDYFSANRNNVELSQGNNEKLFLLTEKFPLASLEAFCEQNKEIQDYLVSQYKQPIHDLIDLQLIYSRLSNLKSVCQEKKNILDAIRQAGRGLGLVFKDSNTSFLEIPEYNNPQNRKNLVNGSFTSTIKGKPITFYLNHSEIDKFSKMFYQGQFTLFDNSETFRFIDSVMTKNKETQPFYFYLFNSIISMSDGALSEYIAGVCLDYFELYTCEYFSSVESKEYNVNETEWTTYIGWQLYAQPEFEKFKNKMEMKLRNSCSQYYDDWRVFSEKAEKYLEE